MKIGKKKARIIQGAIQDWEDSALLSKEEASRLQESLEITPFDWRRLAKYSFWIAIICIVIAVQALLVDLKNILKILWETPLVGTLLFALLSAPIFFWGHRRRSQQPERIFSNEALFFLGILAIAVSIAFLGKALERSSGHLSLLFLLATFIYAGLGLWFPSKLVWLFALISLGSWFGTETGYASGWGAYWLHMNYPLRFVWFGLLVVGLSYAFKKFRQYPDFVKVTYVMGLLYLFIALWILSIFGNYDDMARWIKAGKFDLFVWSLLFLLAALAVIYVGLKHDDPVSRGFGITFLFINLYTRYFEYFWNALHKAIFFGILGASFWYLGSRAEKIWLLGERFKPENEGENNQSKIN